MDAGLRQLNIGYFGQQVKASCQSLESYTHLDIAVNLLKQHYKSSKNWLMVVGRYYYRPAGGKQQYIINSK